MKHYRSYERIVSFLAAGTKPLVRLEVEGLEHIPKDKGAILVLNHISQLDPILAGVALKDTRQVRALAKESLFRKPLIGKAMKAMGHIPVLRGGEKAKDSLALASLRLREGELIGLYPEGTIPPATEELGLFKSGAARLALTSKALVIPVAGWGAQAVLPRDGGKMKSLAGAFLKRPVHRIRIGEPLGPLLGDPEDRERVEEHTETLRNAVLELLRELKAEG